MTGRRRSKLESTGAGAYIVRMEDRRHATENYLKVRRVQPTLGTLPMEPYGKLRLRIVKLEFTLKMA